MDSKNTGASGATEGTAPSARAHHAGDGGAVLRVGRPARKRSSLDPLGGEGEGRAGSS